MYVLYTVIYFSYIYIYIYIYINMHICIYSISLLSPNTTKRAQWWDMYSEDGTAYLRITDRVFCKDRPGFRQNPVGFILGLGPTGFHDKPVGFVIPVPNRPGYTENPTGFDIFSMQGAWQTGRFRHSCSEPTGLYRKPDRVWYIQHARGGGFSCHLFYFGKLHK